MTALLPAKIQVIHNIAYSSEKVISSESGEKYAQICAYEIRALFTSENQLVDIDGILIWEDNRGRTISLKEVLLWSWILARSNVLKLKHINDGFGSYKHTAFHF